MAVLALGLVGAGIGSAIGGTFLGMSAAGIGWNLGVMAGNLLFPQKVRQEGPRVGDLSVQSSTYGTPKPILFGTMRCAGNVIFSTKKREVKTEEEHGGKGGPKVTSTTYTYNVDIAIALCEGPIVGIRKIWSNGKLVFDGSETADASSTVASSVNAQGWKVYLGDETQLPDPTIEATVGVGSTPAYRGTAYVVFDHLDCPNGQVPQLSFEVVASGAAAVSNPIFHQPPATAPTFASIVEKTAWQFVSQNGDASVTRIGPGFHTSEGTRDFSLPTGVSELAPVPAQGGAWALYASFQSSGYAAPLNVVAVPLESGETPRGLLEYVPGSSGNSLRPLYAAYDPLEDKFCAVAAATETAERANAITILPSGVMTDALMTQSTPMAFYDNVIYTCGVSAGETFLNSYDGDTGTLIDSVGAGADYGAQALLVHADASGVYVLDNATANASTDRSVWKVEDGAWTLLSNKVRFDNLDGKSRTWWSNSDYGLVGPSGVSGGVVTYRTVRYRALSADNVDVADIISGICARADLSAGEIDVTDVTQTVRGYSITQVSSARTSIEPLLRAFFLDAPESDGKIKFQRRAGKTAVAAIPFEALGAGAQGSGAADPFPLTRGQEAELPRSVALTFINYEFDYQPGTETARRQVTESVFDVTDQLPMATTSGHMATVASTLLYDAWAQRTTRKATLDRTYAHLDVGDNVTVEYPDGTTSNKRITSMTDDGSLVQLELVDSDPDTYSMSLPGATPAGGQTGVEFTAPTRLELLDIPLLRDADDATGIYAAVQGYSGSWSGAAVYSGDTETDLVLDAATSQEAVIGFASTVLADWSRNLIDETNTVDVQLVRGTLSSTTRDNILSGDTNACLLGDEILQFRTATSLGGSAYRLSGLRRGRRGTEWARSTHAAGERFVLLQTTGLLRLPMDLVDLDTQRSYMAVTYGQSVAEAGVKAFTAEGVSQKPLAPANLDIAIDGQSIRMRWVRRSRYRDNWLAGTVPLAEASEAYEIEILPAGGGTLTYSTSTPSLVVDAAAFVSSEFYGRGARFAVSSGGYVYAVDESGVITKSDADDLEAVASTASSTPAAVLSCNAMLLSGSNIFAAGGGNPAGGIKGGLHKFDLSLARVGFSEFPLVGDGINVSNGHGMVLCAGSLWCGLVYSGKIYRYDPATLLVSAVVNVGSSALATDGSYVYALAGGGTQLVKIDPASNTVVATYTIDVSSLSDLVVSNGYAFTSGSDSRLRVYRTSDGQEVLHGMANSGFGRMSVFGDYVSVCVGAQVFGGPGIVYVIDASALAYVGLIELEAEAIPQFSASLLSASQVLASTDAGSNARYYDLTELGAGTEFRVYQVSADVGRGFAAERTI